MKTTKTTICLGIVIIILISSVFLASCTTEAGTVSEIQNTTTTQTTTTPISTTPTATTTQTTTTPISTTPTATTTTTTTTTVTTTAVEPEDILIPVVGTEFPEFSWKQDKWTILQFDYEAFHEVRSDWHYLWSLTIKNESATDLELTAYILYIGFHNWIGHLTGRPFVLTAGETKTLVEEDILSEALVEEIVYIEYMNVEVYVAER